MSHGCSGDDGSGDGGGSVFATSDGQSRGELEGVSFVCTESQSSGTGELGVDCTHGGEPPSASMQLGFAFTTDYREAAEGDVLVQGTDFTVFFVSYFADGGFGAAGQDTVAGDLTMTVGPRATTTPAMLVGELTEGTSGGQTFSIVVDDVPATLP